MKPTYSLLSSHSVILLIFQWFYGVLGTGKLMTDMILFLFRYYSALKTMEQLENIYIPRVSQYRFCQIMAETLPKLREEIKEISMSDLKDFLESIRKHSDKIGETAMRQVGFCFVLNVAVSKPSLWLHPNWIDAHKWLIWSAVHRCLHIIQSAWENRLISEFAVWMLMLPIFWNQTCGALNWSM